jgi:hypothetical protein
VNALSELGTLTVSAKLRIPYATSAIATPPSNPSRMLREEMKAGYEGGFRGEVDLSCKRRIDGQIPA